MKLILLRKLLRKLRLRAEYKTDRIGEFKITYKPATDIGDKLYLGKEFEQTEIDIACTFIDSNSTVLDIGANIGLHSLSYATAANNGSVIACEPQPDTFKILQHNISQNGVENITALNIAIADSAKLAELYVMEDDGYSSLVYHDRKKLLEKIPVLCSTVDGLLGDIKVDLVKIDVEGLELDVLKSMKSLLSLHQPNVFCEIYKGKQAENNPRETISFMKSLGYRPNRIIDGKMIPFGIGEQHQDKYYNYVFTRI